VKLDQRDSNIPRRRASTAQIGLRGFIDSRRRCTLDPHPQTGI